MGRARKNIIATFQQQGRLIELATASVDFLYVSVCVSASFLLNLSDLFFSTSQIDIRKMLVFGKEASIYVTNTHTLLLIFISKVMSIFSRKKYRGRIVKLFRLVFSSSSYYFFSLFPLIYYTFIFFLSDEMQ